ncbi:MAG: Glycosyl transferase, group 1 [uncultured Rubrobacteraceae bacterium]|uniref:Glycosyl transferase, group 1 n=1 Tax=uncultured Rubrobacteraceae bacterium TaxID=349277 RepID=A0A6J4R519_9ACTN|nr:MAG: Glycosyl transferase, group 1 [uncultured Rubrobacteraceae bacterium]
MLRFMQLLMTHGYMLSGSGSNVYVQNLCRGLVKVGHDVHLLCQEPEPLRYDFVNEHFAASGGGVEALGEQETPYEGSCAVYAPDIGDLLPVYVYDDYPGWRVKTFLDLEEEELDRYVAGNVAAVRAVLKLSGAEGVVTNHSVPGPEVARLALEGTGVPYTSIVHGSCLQYVARNSARYMEMAGRGLSGAASIVALSTHSAGTIAEDFPKLAGRTLTVPGGVDTDLFRPGRLDLSVTEDLGGGPGRGPEQTEKLRGILAGTGGGVEANGLARELAEVSASYEPRKHDLDAGGRIRKILGSGDPVVVYVGKLIHSKGVHSLLSGFARARGETGARLLVVGYGTFREGLEALVHALSTGNRPAVEALARGGRIFEGGPASPMEHFEVSDGLMRDAEGMEEYVEFVGPLYHNELSRVLPAADVAVVPSIFPETFGLVAAEFGASGVPPFVADHSGLREAGGLVGRGLPFDTRVGLEGSFEENLARALTGYLSLPEDERRECRGIVERNAVEDLSWGALAERISALAAGTETKR